MKKNYYLFVGQNATTGTPNEKTGRMSFYGCILKFISLKERAEYIEEKTGFSCQEKIVIGGIKEMRSMNLGSSLANFNDYILHIEDTIKDNTGNWI